MVLTEANIAVLCDHMQKNVEWRYPLTSGATQYDLDIGTGMQVVRRGEPINKAFPTIVMDYVGYGEQNQRGLGNILQDYSGTLVYGYTEIIPLIITIYAHLDTRGTTRSWHGKLVSAAYRDRVTLYMRKYWPQLLEGMEAKIYDPFSWKMQDISRFFEGNELQGWEITMNISSVNKWNYQPDDYPGSGANFEDASLLINESGLTAEEIISISGAWHDLD